MTFATSIVCKNFPDHPSGKYLSISLHQSMLRNVEFHGCPLITSKVAEYLSVQLHPKYQSTRVRCYEPKPIIRKKPKHILTVITSLNTYSSADYFHSN